MFEVLLLYSVKLCRQSVFLCLMQGNLSGMVSSNHVTPESGPSLILHSAAMLYQL